MQFSFNQLTTSSRVEISRSALIHNIKTIRAITGQGVSIAAVVKASAYGHGYSQITNILKNQDIRFFAVHSIDEAETLTREHPDLPILILGYVPADLLGYAIDKQWRLSLYNIETIQTLSKLTARTGNSAFVHLKLETGANRQGIDARLLPEFIEALKRHPKVVPEGATMHFANIEDTTNHSFAQEQLAKYREMLEQIESAGIKISIRHAASSAASLLFDKTHFDMVRIGISMYGLWPSKETYLSYMMSHGKDSLLKPVLSWKSIVAQIKNVPAGEYIGYGCTYRTTADSRIAVVPIGYYDGYDRKLSNLGYVLIRGRRAPVRGRICMDMFMVDVTHIPDVRLEDEVVLIGRQGDEELTADQLADWADTINYEVVSRINPLLPRVIVE
jgi:alanine racemase